MKDRIHLVAAKLAKKMADGLLAEPGAPERHRALGVADAYQILQEEFPELFSGNGEATTQIRKSSDHVVVSEGLQPEG